MDYGVPIANGASVAVLIIVLGALFRWQRVQGRRDRAHEREIAVFDYRLEVSELENRHCQRNFGILAGLFIRAGGQVPPELFEPSPKPTRPDPRIVEEAHR